MHVTIIILIFKYSFIGYRGCQVDYGIIVVVVVEVCMRNLAVHRMIHSASTRWAVARVHTHTAARLPHIRNIPCMVARDTLGPSSFFLALPDGGRELATHFSLHWIRSAPPRARRLIPGEDCLQNFRRQKGKTVLVHGIWCKKKNESSMANYCAHR